MAEDGDEVEAVMEAVPAGPPPRGGDVTFTVTITARLPAEAGTGAAPPLRDPYFRFRFLDGTKVVTTPVGTTNEDEAPGDVVGCGVWTRRVTVPRPKDDDSPEQADEGDEAAAAAAAEGEEEEAPVDETAPWVWTQTFGPIKSTEAFARSIDNAPTLAVFVGDSAGQRGRRYVADCVLDASAFLGGQVELAETHGVDDAAGWNEGTDLAAATFAGFNYLDVRVRASHQLLDAGLEARLNPLAVTVHKAKDLPGARLDPYSDVERPFAQPDLFRLLQEHCAPVYCLFKFPFQPLRDDPFKPAAIAAATATAAAAAAAAEPDALDAATAASGVSAAGDAAAAGSGRQHQQDGAEPAPRDRVCFTRGVFNAEKVRWDYTTVFLAGTQDAKQLYERLDSRPLTVELHDRDVLPAPEVAAAHHERFEDLAQEYAATYAAAETAEASRGGKAKKKEAPKTAKGKKGKKGAAQAEAAAPASAPAGTADAVANAEDPLASVPDVFEADRQFLADREASLLVAGDSNSFGLASFRMDGLLNRAGELRQGLKRAGLPEAERGGLEQSVEVKLTEHVMQQKRRVVPTGAAKIAEWDMSTAERLCRRPGSYGEHQTRLSASFRIARPVHQAVSALEKAPLPVFERVVYIFPYDDLAMLRSLRDCIDAVNAAAIPRVSLPSYQLTPGQQAAADRGELDIVGGVQIVEEGQRLLVVEGLVDGGMARLRAALPRAAIAEKDPATTKVFANPEVLFTARLYTAFDVDLKMIRLRRPLAAILKSPDIYNRANVSATCFDALHCLGEMKKANRMRTLKVMDLFPSVAGLEELESKYGETVTLMDMRGVAKRPPRMNAAAAMKTAGGGAKGGSTIGGALGMMVAAKLKGRAARVRNKAPTDARNSAYLQALESWKPKDFLSGQAQKAATLKEKTRLRKEAEFEEAKKDPTPVYIYGTQRLNSMAVAQAKQREMVAKDTNATYTYAPDYVGQTIAPVDPFAVEEAERAAAKAKFVTPKGFVYPAPRSPEEFRRHPRAPSEAQREELAQPWDGPPGSSSAADGSERGSLFDNKLLTAEGFNTRLRPVDKFGLMRKDGTKDEGFFRSVHCGDADAQAAEEKKKAEAAEWRSKVVVDTLYVRPVKSLKHGNQLDRLSGMLDGKPQKKGLQAEAVPALIPHDPYVEPREREKAAMSGRGTTLPKEELGGRPQFETRINPNFGKPKASMATSARSIPGMDPAEKVGPKWASTASASAAPASSSK